MRWLILFSIFLFLISNSLAVELNYDCPSSVEVLEEFECKVSLIDGSGVYDLKFDISKGSGSVGKIYDESSGDFKSAYYYLKEFISQNEKKVLLKVEEAGEYEAYFKIRKGSSVNDFLVELEVLDAEEKEEFIEEEIEKKEEVLEEEKEKIKEKNIVLNEPLILNSNEEIDLTGEVIYESKNYKVLEYLPYVFCIFLIFIIGILLREKF